MRLQVTDANDITQTICATSVESITVRDGSIIAANVSQQLAPANPLRSGWLLQNTSASNLFIEDAQSAAVIQKGYMCSGGEMMSTISRIPITTNALYIIGATLGQTFTFREW